MATVRIDRGDGRLTTCASCYAVVRVVDAQKHADKCKKQTRQKAQERKAE